MDTLRTVSDLAALEGTPRRLLAVFAHPDDEAYGCAGALARAGADPRAATVLLCMTRGEASSMGARLGLAAEQVGALRERRLQDVARRVHLDGLVVPGLPDGRLARLDLEDLAAPVREVLAAFRPQVLITHDPRGVNGHPDHIATHWGVRRALQGRSGVRLACVAYPPETCEAARPRLLFPTPVEEIDATLRLAPSEVEAKEDCLRIHEALVTLEAGAGDGRMWRPPLEHYDVMGEAWDPPRSDLFA